MNKYINTMKRNYWKLFFLVGLFLTDHSISFAEGDASGSEGFEEKQTRMSYLLGYRDLDKFEKEGLSISADAFVLGAAHAINGDSPIVGEDEGRELIAYFKAQLEQERIKNADQNLVRSNEFMAKNKSQKGVIATESGLQYRIVREGDGASPEPENPYYLTDFEIRLISGEVIDSSYEQGMKRNFGWNRVTEGWKEAMQLMKEGGKYEFYIPSDLAYGANGYGKIGPNQALIVLIELYDANYQAE